MVVNPYLRD